VEDLADTQLDAAVYAVSVVEFGRGEVDPAMHKASQADMGRLYDEMERLLGAGPFFCGSYSLADIAVVPHVMTATFLGFGLDAARHPELVRWFDRVQQRPALVRDNADVMSTLQQLQEEKRQAFDPYRVQWRSDRLGAAGAAYSKSVSVRREISRITALASSG
jgi:glutathione S-transferase